MYNKSNLFHFICVNSVEFLSCSAVENRFKTHVSVGQQSISKNTIFDSWNRNGGSFVFYCKSKGLNEFRGHVAQWCVWTPGESTSVHVPDLKTCSSWVSSSWPWDEGKLCFFGLTHSVQHNSESFSRVTWRMLEDGALVSSVAVVNPISCFPLLLAFKILIHECHSE